MKKTFSDIICKVPVAKVNEDLIYNIRQESLAEYVVDAFKTLESKHLKMTDWELITDESKFDPDQINVKHIKANKNKKYTKRLSMTRSRYDLLRMHFHLKASDGECDETLELLLFKTVKNYYYVIDGNKFYPIYQLLDSSTYTTKDFATLKSMLLPIAIKKIDSNITTVQGDVLYAPVFNLCIFKKKIKPILYYLATIGFNNTMRYFQMEDIIDVSRNKKYDKNEQYCFRTNKGFYIKVIKYFFDNDLFTRNVVNMLHGEMEDCESTQDLHSNEYWTIRLGSRYISSTNSQDLLIKGKGIIVSFHRLLDRIIKKNLKHIVYNKRDSYAIVRWMMRDFYDIKAKDNMDLKNKRIRLAEYIAAYVIKKLSGKMNSFLAESNVKLEDVQKLIAHDKNMIIRTVIGSKAPLLRYDNSVNDMDLFTALKYSSKGPSSIGEKGGNSINIKYRGIHTSYVSRLDLNTSGSSDPGLSGIITPFCELHGKFFSEEPEPDNWSKNFKKLYSNYFNGSKLKVKKLDYFYSKMKKSEKALRRLEDIKCFIDDDPYNDMNGYIAIDVTKNKPKLIRIKRKGEITDYIKDDETDKKKKKKKKSTKKKEVVDNVIEPKKKTVIRIFRSKPVDDIDEELDIVNDEDVIDEE